MRSQLSLLAAGARANVVAGTRLALFLKVSPFDFRVSAGHYAVLVLISVLFWAAGGMVREGIPEGVDMQSLAVALAQVPLLLLACVLAAHLFGRPALALAFAVLLTAGDPLFEAAGTALRFLVQTDVLEDWAGTVNLLYIGWGYAVMIRAQWLLTGWRTPRSLVAGAMFAALLAAFVFVLPRNELWTGAPEAPSDEQPSIVREDLLHLQAGLLEFRLAELEPERPGVEDLYFIGVAPYALQDTFVRELDVVKRLMDGRFDTAGRSLVLVNHAATLQEQPIATATNLRSAIERVAAGINTEEDVLFLFLTSHGNEAHELAFELPPLQLQQLTPTALARMLNDSGIKWKIVVVSACFSGAYIEPLKDEFTLVITASDDRHQSFGCEYDSDFTWFSKAYFDQALRGTQSFTEAFERARAAIVEREKGRGLAPSNPQMAVGAAMREKLESITRRLEAQGGASPGIQAALQ
jgi:hypothetical protein